MHAFDTPMATGGVCDPLDIERGQADEIAGVEGAAIGMLGAAVDLDQGLDVGEARLAWIAAGRSDPIDFTGERIGSGLDAAVALLYGGLGDQFVFRGTAEIVGDLGFEIGLIALRASR